MTDNLPGVFPVGQEDSQASNTKNKPLSVGGMAKEQLESSPLNMSESAPVVELREDERVPEAVENWVERLEYGEEVKLPQPVSDDDGQVLVEDSGVNVSEDSIVLPLTKEQVEEGLHKKVYNSARWLAEWCVRVAKKLHGQVVYRMQAEQGNN